MERDRQEQPCEQASETEAGAVQMAVPVDVLRPAAQPERATPFLLAVDCGLHTGLALFSDERRLLWYRSHHLGSRSQLKRAVVRILDELPGLRHLVIEGGGTLAEVWLKAAQQRSVAARRVDAEQWRCALLLSRERRSGRQAKQVADGLARAVIVQAGAPRPTSLRHDAAEAILIGWWALTSGRPRS